MNRVLSAAFAVAALTAAVAVQAQTYQWKDSRGRTVISDTPPPPSARAAGTVTTGQPAATPAAAAADAPKTTAEKDLDFRKRQQEAREKAEKDSKDQAAATQKRENCERAQRNLALLESDQGVVTADEQGQRRAIEGAERQAEIARTRQIVADTCK